MAVEAVVKTGALAVSSGSADFTEPGFGTPDAVIVFVTQANTTDNPTTYHPALSVGVYDGTSQWVCQAKNIERYSSTGNIASSSDLQYQASFITDGVRITSPSTSLSRYALVMLIKGLNGASAGTFTAEGGGTVTGLGFNPNFVLHAGIGSSTAATSANANTIFSIGLSHKNGGTIKNYWFGYDADEENHVLFTDKCTGQYYNGTINWSEAISSFDSGGFTLGDGSGSGDVGFYLALELPSDDDVFAEVIDTKGSTGTQAYTGWGFEPVALGVIATGGTVAGTTEAAAEDNTSEGLFLGMDDASTKASGTLACEPGGGVDESEYTSSYSLYVTSGGTPVQEGYVNSFDSDGFTYQFDTSGSSVKALVFGFGTAAAGGGAPSLSSPGVINVLSDRATPQVTLTF